MATEPRRNSYALRSLPPTEEKISSSNSDLCRLEYDSSVRPLVLAVWLSPTGEQGLSALNADETYQMYSETLS